MVETRDKKKAVETYVCDMRNKVSERLGGSSVLWLLDTRELVGKFILLRWQCRHMRVGHAGQGEQRGRTQHCVDLAHVHLIMCGDTLRWPMAVLFPSSSFVNVTWQSQWHMYYVYNSDVHQHEVRLLSLSSRPFVNITCLMTALVLPCVGGDV